MYKNYTHVKTWQGRVCSKLWDITKFSLLAAVVSFPAFDAWAVAAERIDLSIAQGQQTFSGTVLDAESKPLTGVSISIKGKASSGTTTDASGRFTLAANNNDTLVFTMVGYSSVERTLQAGQTNLSVTLSELVSSLDDVVVVGFGTQKKANLTGAVVTIDSKSLENRAVSNVVQALQGVMPGLNITQTKGYLNQSPAMNVRGVGTIGEGSSSAPLVLVDGIEADLSRINPNDIETVTVLKDAAASSIYGSRAPFGVILVTTKRGKKGTFVTNFNSSLRWQQFTTVPEIVDSYTFATYFNETATNGGTAGHFSPERLQKIKDFQAGKLTGALDPDVNSPNMWSDVYNFGYANTDWFRLLFKDKTFGQEHNVSINGGGEKVQAYGSVNFLDQGGFVALNPESNQRIGTNLKVSFQPSEHVDITYNVRYNNITYKQPSALTDNIFTLLTRQGWPTLPAYDPNGFMHANATNALALRDGGVATTKSDEAIHALNVVIEPVKDWKIVGNLNYSRYNERWHSETLKLYNHDVNGDPYQYTAGGKNTGISESYKGNRYFNPNIYSEYQKNIQDHYFKVMAGFQTEIFTQDIFGAGRFGIISPGLHTINTTDGTDGDGKTSPPSVNGSINKWSTVGVFGRLNYNYAERYLLEANLRYDGTSRFRKDQRWRLFPSISVGWNIANEGFFEPLRESVNVLKFRGSWGELGNQNTNAWYPTYVTMPVNTANGAWLINGAKPNTAAAPDLISQAMGWETVRSVNLGLDLNMLNNRLEFTFDYYKRWTNNMIGPAPEMPLLLGIGVPKTNNTDLYTTGWETNFRWSDRLESGLGYSVGFNITDYSTTITNYPNDEGTLSKYYSGKKMGEIWGYQTIGIAKSLEEMNAHLSGLPNRGQDALGSNWDAGDIMYADLNGDGKIDRGTNTLDDYGDMKVIGNTSPRYNFGILLGSTYKGFDISVFLQGVMKKDYYTTSSQDFWGAGGGIWESTVLKDHLDYFRPNSDHHLGQNLDSFYPRPLWSGKNKQTQSRYLIDGSYIRLKNLSFGYTVPNNVTEKAGLRNLRFSFSGENLWTGTKTPKMYDPETMDSNDGRVMYPLSKVYSFGVKADF